MRRYILLTIFWLIFIMTHKAISQTVNTVRLTNGFTVILAEDHSEPKVFGAVAVRAGSKNDPQDMTGMAHYFEHIMFKGTDKIGTVDYEREKPLLDQIAALYDELPRCEGDETKRSEVLQRINGLSIEASQYAIAGELDRLLNRYGGSNINAYTHYDHTAYFNIFAPNHIDKWLSIYAERFRNPVFRMFQAELETVYEERNMYADMTGAKAIEDILQQFIKKHPYRNPVIGSVEHLKNPSINRMNEFYRQYYVAGNMALVLVGDFDASKVMPVIEATFGSHPAGDAPVFPAEQYQEEEFNGREFFSGRYFPVKAGVIAYRGVPMVHPDRLVLDYCAKLLSNESHTGMLDQLRTDNHLNMAMSVNIALNDLGGVGFVFVPKLFGSLKKNEKRVLSIIDSLKEGRFDEGVFENLKLSALKERVRTVEDKMGMGNLLVELFSSGRSWEDYMAETERCRTISKQDIVEVANRYFTDNRLVFYNKSGLTNKAEKIRKPGYAPLQSANGAAQSAFARKLAALPDTPYAPVFIDLKRDFTCEDLQPNVHLVTGKNPLNNIFTLVFRFGIGQNANKLMDLLPMHLPELGVGEQTVNEFRLAMQKIGASYEMFTDMHSVAIKVDGFDWNFEQTVAMVNDLMQNIKPDNRQIRKLRQDVRERNRMERKDPQSIGRAHRSRIIMGDKSEFLHRASTKEIVRLKSEELTVLFDSVRQYETTIEYVGTLPSDRVKEIISSTVIFPQNVLPADKTYHEILDYDEPLISTLDCFDVNQTSYWFYVPSIAGNDDDRIAALFFSLYFGGGMSSVLFHELRERRSLSYSSSARFKFPSLKYAGFKGFLAGNLATQADKTGEAVELVIKLIDSPTERPELIDNLRNMFRESINNTLPSFRDLPEYGYSMLEQGYTEDFRKTMYESADLLNFRSITRFHRDFIRYRPVVHILSGNTHKMDLQGLTIKRQELKLKDVMRR